MLAAVIAAVAAVIEAAAMIEAATMLVAEAVIVATENSTSMVVQPDCTNCSMAHTPAAMNIQDQPAGCRDLVSVLAYKCRVETP